jgi:anti-sigma-K factor RskA
MSDHDEIGRYVLGDLPPRDAARLRAREDGDPGFAAEVSRLRDTVRRVEALDDEHWSLPSPPPPPLVPATPRSGADGRRRSGRRLVLRPVAALAAALTLMLVGGVGGALLDDDRGEPAAEGRLVVLRALGPGPHTVRARARLATGEDGTLALTVSGLARSVGASFYEVWLLRSPTSLVSVGTFRVGADGRARVRFPLTADTRRFNVLDVSLEAPDGDPSHSKVSVLRSRPVRG